MRVLHFHRNSFSVIEGLQWVTLYFMFCVFQYDYDNDGLHEVLLATADGIVIFVKSDGTFLEGETLMVSDTVTLTWKHVYLDALDHYMF